MTLASTFESLAHARERLRAQVAETAGAHSPSPKAAVLNGASPARALSAHAKSANADLIVVGTHGRTGIAQVLIGSVAERIVRYAPAAALIVRSGQ